MSLRSLPLPRARCDAVVVRSINVRVACEQHAHYICVAMLRCEH